MLARNSGPAAVGVYALLHVLPGLVGTIASSGLPVATPYFLAGPDRDDPRLPSTLVAIAIVGGTFGAVVGALLLADSLTASFAWTRLARRHFFRRITRPSPLLARRIASYGLRGQVGGVMSLLNLRLESSLLSVLAGPAVLGVYAVASKFAELIRILGMALQYVFYPAFA